MGKRLWARWSRVEESVDRKLNIVAGSKVAKCELRDVIYIFYFNGKAL